jgi:hypothetical protein
VPCVDCTTRRVALGYPQPLFTQRRISEPLPTAISIRDFFPPFNTALYNKNPEIVKLLLKKGASIDLKYINNTSEECKDIILNEIEIKTKMILKRLIDIDNVTKQDLIINILSFI